MLEAIAAAENTIDFLTFVYWKGEVGTRFARALCDRAKAGVRVRLCSTRGEQALSIPLSSTT